MGKEYEMKTVQRYLLTEVVCDDCGVVCTNSHFDIYLKMSFNPKSELLRTVCYKCWDKRKLKLKKDD